MTLPNNREEPSRLEKMGPFRLRGRLGESGRSCVFVAAADHLDGRNKIVGLRQIPALRPGDRRPLHTVLAQARQAAALRHPNLLALEEVGEQEGVGYVAMEYVAGEELETILTHPSGRGMPPEIAMVLLRQIADALLYRQEGSAPAGQSGEAGGLPWAPVHPRDVFVGYDGTVRLLAPGLVARAEAGGPQYQAPEVLGGAEISEAATVFCLGIVLWQCLAGRFLFVGRRGERPGSAVHLRPIEAPSAFRPEVSKDVDAVVLQALDRDPSRRFAGLGEFLRALDQVAQDWIRPTREGVGLWMRALFGPERGTLKARIAQGRDLERSIRRLRELDLGGGGLGGGTPVGGVRLRPLWTSTSENQTVPLTASDGSPLPEGKATPAEGTPLVEGYDEPPTALRNPPAEDKGGSRSWGRVAGFLGLLILAGGAGGLFWWRSQLPLTSATVQAAAGRWGRLEITSAPPGALLMIDGAPTGLSTPATLGQLRVGRTIRLDVQKAGYQSAGRQVTVAGGKPQTVDFPLLEADGRVVLESQ